MHTTVNMQVDIVMLIPVIQKQERISPLSKGSNHFLFCSSVPNMWSTSIFPVSVETDNISYPIPNPINSSSNELFAKFGKQHALLIIRHLTNTYVIRVFAVLMLGKKAKLFGYIFKSKLNKKIIVVKTNTRKTFFHMTTEDIIHNNNKILSLLYI